MNMSKIAGLGCGLLMLGGCASNAPVGVQDIRFGDAVQQNIAGQIVNPAAPEDRGPLTMNAERAALQQGRYLADMVEKPVDISTQSTQSGGGGGGGGGGAGAGAGAAAP